MYFRSHAFGHMLMCVVQPIGLLKAFATRSAHECADEAVQIFGGRALTQSGMG